MTHECHQTDAKDHVDDSLDDTDPKNSTASPFLFDCFPGIKKFFHTHTVLYIGVNRSEEKGRVNIDRAHCSCR